LWCWFCDGSGGINKGYGLHAKSVSHQRGIEINHLFTLEARYSRIYMKKVSLPLVSISHCLKFWDFVLHDYLFTNSFDVMIGSMMFSNLYEKSEFIFGLNFSLSKVLRFWSFVY
jgi:hypothetical protein